MPSFAELIQQSSAHAWLFIPSAILLGALHGLEPGHSKTMMAAVIVAIRGTVTQAALLGIAATISHTLVVWIIALGGMFLWRGVDTQAIKMWVLIMSSGAAAVAGMLYAGRLQSGRFQLGEGDELSVIAAAVLGGTSLFGGAGTVVGTIVGALMIGLINNGLILMGLEFSQQLIARGAIIIIAVAISQQRK